MTSLNQHRNLFLSHVKEKFGNKTSKVALVVSGYYQGLVYFLPVIPFLAWGFLLF